MDQELVEAYRIVQSEDRWNAVMEALEAEGLAEVVTDRHGQPAYRLTEKGRDWLASQSGGNLGLGAG